MMDIRPVSIMTILADYALISEHWKEIAKNKQLMVLKPMYDRYEAMEKAGILICLGAFDGDRLVGYAASIVSPHLHYADLVTASNDIIFLLPEYRLGHTGLKLIRETERIAKEDHGCRMVSWHAKDNTTLNELVPKMGYHVQDVIWTREV